MSRKKILFVTHALESYYGASTSLRLLLKNYPDVEADIVVPRSLSRPRDLKATAALYPCIRHVHEMSLPQDLSLVGIRKRPMEMVHQALHRLLWLRDRARLRALIRENRYDVIHLNSPVLHEVMTPGMPAVTHIRDIILDHASPVISKLVSGLGLIFIDVTTRRPFEKALSGVPNTILNNPIDMTGMAAWQGAFQHPLLKPTTTVLSVIGRVSEIKGVDMVIAAFRAGAVDDAMLLIAGDGPADYEARCRAAAGDDPRIVFCGAEGEIRKIYAVTDHVVRGDPQGCIGRTVYEGLYAGCGVIMPGAGEPDFLFESEKFAQNIVLYRSGDRQALAQAIAAAQRRPPMARDGFSNTADYAAAFDAFLEECIARRVSTSERADATRRPTTLGEISCVS